MNEWMSECEAIPKTFNFICRLWITWGKGIVDGNKHKR